MNTKLKICHDTYAAARNAEYTFPSPLYVSLIAACVDSRVCTKRDGTGGINFCRCGYISVPSSFVRLELFDQHEWVAEELGRDTVLPLDHNEIKHAD